MENSANRRRAKEEKSRRVSLDSINRYLLSNTTSSKEKEMEARKKCRRRSKTLTAISLVFKPKQWDKETPEKNEVEKERSSSFLFLDIFT